MKEGEKVKASSRKSTRKQNSGFLRGSRGNIYSLLQPEIEKVDAAVRHTFNFLPGRSEHLLGSYTFYLLFFSFSIISPFFLIVHSEFSKNNIKCHRVFKQREQFKYIENSDQLLIIGLLLHFLYHQSICLR